MQDCSADAAPCAAATPAGAQLGGSGKGRRASCPEANVPSRSYRAHRQALEEQQRAATVFMSDKSKVWSRCCADDSLTTERCESMAPFLVALQPPTSRRRVSRILRDSNVVCCLLCRGFRPVFWHESTSFGVCLTHQPGSYLQRSFVCSTVLIALLAFSFFFAARVQQTLISLRTFLFVRKIRTRSFAARRFRGC